MALTSIRRISLIAAVAATVNLTSLLKSPGQLAVLRDTVNSAKEAGRQAWSEGQVERIATQYSTGYSSPWTEFVCPGGRWGARLW
jgi:hypothetical protein